MSEVAHDAPTLGERAAIGRIGAALFGGDAELPVLGRYRVIERLGAGAFGAVYLAEDPQLRRRVAIKLAHRSHGDIAWRERQRREWLALAKLAHPNIVGVHTVESTVDARWFIVMELVDGGDLRKWLASSPARAQILDVLAQAGRGLAAAHAAGLVHRDFKPDNVLLAPQGATGEIHAKVGDFGLARELAVAEDSADAIATHSGAAGTPAYMAPEQILHGHADAKSDQFAFCVSAFEALTGARPFRGRTAIELAHAAEAGAIEGASRLPSSVRGVVLRGLAGDPKRRHRDMDALLAAWDRRPRAGPIVAIVALGASAIAMASTPVHAAATSCDRDDAIDRDAEHVRTQVSRRIADARVDEVSARLSSFVADMHGTRTEVCGAAASIELFDRQSVCLAGAERALATLREWIPRARSDADLVLATLALPDPATCLDPREDSAPAIDPAARVAIEAELERARTGYLLGDDATAELAASTAAASARDVEWTNALARARLWSAQVALRRSDAEAAATAAEKAVIGAESSGDDVLVATAAIVAVSANGSGRRDLARADQWARRAEAALDRVADPSRLRARLLLVRASARIATGHFEEARPLLDEGLAIDAPLDASTIAMLGDASVLASYTGDPIAAERFARRAMAGTEALYGATHPGIAAASGNLSVALLAQGRYREAEEAATHALSLGDPHGAGALAYRINVGIAQQCRGKMTDAIATYRVALADAEQHAEGDALERVQILVNLAEALSLSGDHDGARTAVARASTELDAVAPAQHPARAMVLASEAATARRRGDAVSALSAAERAAAFEGLPPPWRMPVLLELGEALLANARGSEAIAPLREAAALTGFDARVSAQVAAALSHALVSTGATTEAQTIATAALASYPEEGEPQLRETLAMLAGR